MVVTAIIAGPKTGDQADLRFWYSSSSSSGGNGINGTINLIDIQRPFGGELNFTFVISIQGEESSPMFPTPEGGFKITIKVADCKPNMVMSSSSKFLIGPWITGLTTNFGFSGSQEICFPLLPPEKRYENKDWFLVRFNDTTGLYCEYIENQRAFKGTVKKYNNRSDTYGEPVIGGDKYTIYTKDNPFRLGAIVIHSSITTLINKEFKGIGPGYYGMTVGTYRSSTFNYQPRKNNNCNDQINKLRGYDGRGRIK